MIHKQKKIKFEPRIKLNHNIYIDVSSAGNNTRPHKTIIVTVQDNS